MTRIAKPKRSKPNPIPHVEPAPAQLPMFPRTREQIGAESKARWPRYPIRVGRRVRVSGEAGRIVRRYPLDGVITYAVTLETGSRVLVDAGALEVLP